MELNDYKCVGRLVRDPELAFTKSGKSVCEVTIAVNDTFPGRDGETKENTAFVPVVFWGSMADVICKYLKKGSPIFVEARMETQSWEREGKKHSVLKAICKRFQFLPGNKKENTIEVRTDDPEFKVDPFTSPSPSHQPFPWPSPPPLPFGPSKTNDPMPPTPQIFCGKDEDDIPF